MRTITNRNVYTVLKNRPVMHLMSSATRKLCYRKDQMHTI